jgi:predicted ribosome quality control (RQC) complex YloA/Tae2 family protein
MGEKLSLDSNELEVVGLKFSFLKNQSFWERQNLIFGKIKKLKRAEKLLSVRLIDVEDEIKRIEKKEIEVKTTKEKAIPVNWNYSPKREKEKDKNINSSDIISFRYKKTIGVLGLTADANDQIRHECHKNHIWFHIENYPGAHLVLKIESVSLFDGDDFSILASMLRDYSKLNISTIPIMYSELRYVKGIKGKKGQVIVKKPKYLSCIYRDWKEIITIV